MAAVRYNTWRLEALEAEEARLAASAASPEDGGHLGRVRAEIQRRKTVTPRADEDWQAGGWLQAYRIPPSEPGGPFGWRPPKKANALLALVRETFGARWPVVFGYREDVWKIEISRRVTVAADRERVLDEIARAEFEVWARSLARRVLTAKQSGGAVADVAREIAASWRGYVHGPDGKRLPDVPPLQARTLTPGASEYRAFLKRLTKAIYDTTRPLLLAKDRTGRPLIRPIDPQMKAALMGVARATLALPAIERRPEADSSMPPLKAQASECATNKSWCHAAQLRAAKRKVMFCALYQRSCYRRRPVPDPAG
jgi:hypothetical protein